MQAGKVVLGTLAGIAIGAIVGVLLAPDKGSETRKKLSSKGSDYADGLKNKFTGLKDKYNDIVDGVTNKLESISGNADNLAKDATSGMKSTAGAGTSAGRS